MKNFKKVVGLVLAMVVVSSVFTFSLTARDTELPRLPDFSIVLDLINSRLAEPSDNVPSPEFINDIDLPYISGVSGIGFVNTINIVHSTGDVDVSLSQYHICCDFPLLESHTLNVFDRNWGYLGTVEAVYCLFCGFFGSI